MRRRGVVKRGHHQCHRVVKTGGVEHFQCRGVGELAADIRDAVCLISGAARVELVVVVHINEVVNARHAPSFGRAYRGVVVFGSAAVAEAALGVHGDNGITNINRAVSVYRRLRAQQSLRVGFDFVVADDIHRKDCRRRRRAREVVNDKYRRRVPAGAVCAHRQIGVVGEDAFADNGVKIAALPALNGVQIAAGRHHL